MEITQTTLDALIRSGYQPLAIEPNGKAPLHKGWTTASISFEDLLAIGGERFGLRMGDQGLNCLDIDAKNHPQQEGMREEFFSVLRQAGFDDSAVLIQNTPSSGAHLIYRAGTPRKTEVLCRTQCGKTLIETRGEKAQVVMYDISRFRQIPELKVISQEQESLLYNVARSFGCDSKRTQSFREYDESNSCITLLEQRGWSVVGEDAFGTQMLRPDNPSSNTSGKVFKDSNKFFCFSTSTEFEPRRLYSPSEITIALEYAGDRAEFAQAYGFSSGTPSVEPSRNYFSESTVSDMRVLSMLEPPRRLVGGLVHEKENAILFASTNAGKSILGLQIARAVSEGRAVCDLLPNETEPMRTALFDFELSPQQLAQRIKKSAQENPNLSFFHPTGDVYAKPEEVCGHIEAAIIKCKAQFVVIDNISMLAYDNESAADAKALVQGLKDMRQRHDLTLLLIGHSPKRQKYTTIEVKDLAGSAMLGNMFDSVIGLNWSSSGTSFRYLKQLKVRTGAYSFAEDNVLVCSIVDTPVGGVHFEFNGTSPESEHLIQVMERSERDKEILRLTEEEGYSQRDIAPLVGLGKTRVGEILQEMRGARPLDEADNSGQGQ